MKSPIVCIFGNSFFPGNSQITVIVHFSIFLWLNKRQMWRNITYCKKERFLRVLKISKCFYSKIRQFTVSISIILHISILPRRTNEIIRIVGVPFLSLFNHSESFFTLIIPLLPKISVNIPLIKIISPLMINFSD